MLRSSLTLAGLVAIGAAATAQTPIVHKLKPITSSVRDAGTLHVATNTWTRKASTANIGADIIYNNTCSTGYFSGFSGDTFVDEGRIPSPSSPNNLGSKPGCATSYTVDGFQIGYCTDQLPGLTGTYTVNFFQTYGDCTSSLALTPTAGFALNNLPGDPLGTGLCWIITLDLDSPPLTASLAFSMQADGDGTYVNGTTDLFGWSMGSTAAGTNTGPIIAGDTNVCQRFDGTRWDTPINYAEAGTGMSTTNHFYVQGGPTTPGCYYFGGLNMSSFHLEVYADACGPVAPGTVFCDSTSGTACPCAVTPPPVQVPAAGRGCQNSFGTNAGLTATGVASISADTVVLNVDQLPVASTLFFQGTSQQASGAGSAFGDGKRCAGGTVVRLGTKVPTGTPGSATSSYPQGGDLSVSVRGGITIPGVRTYQAWYRNSAPFCTAGVFNLSNGYEITWGA